MTGITAKRLQQRMNELGIDQSELARRVGCSSAAINQLINEKTQNSRFLPTIASRLGVSTDWLLGESDQKVLPQIAIPSPANDTAMLEIAEIDLAYGMGGSFLADDGRIEVETMPFPAKWVRHFTRSPASELFFARGSGDSMMPTIHDADIILIDRAQNTLRMSDQVWAFAFGDVGMIKRLRPMPDGSVVMLSDNPIVPEARAVDGELHIIGRVVAVQKKM